MSGASLFPSTSFPAVLVDSCPEGLTRLLLDFLFRILLHSHNTQPLSHGAESVFVGS
ncbi:hypothetical protein LEMLEM_LOCUS25007, partial [Lemmus lemmus]